MGKSYEAVIAALKDFCIEVQVDVSALVFDVDLTNVVRVDCQVIKLWGYLSI